MSPQVSTPPSQDGDVNEYVDANASQSSWFTSQQRVVFINGMSNSPQDHMHSALALSELQMCPVIGVYNKSDSLIMDLIQCLGDKHQFDGILARDASKALDQILDARPSLTREEAMTQVLARNPASMSLFRVLRSPTNWRAPIFAHSQGNLILSNALSAILAVDGPQAVSGREVHSFGSPAIHWPRGIIHREYGFTFDPVTWLAGFDFSLSISKVGVPLNGDTRLVSHSFLSYKDNDPAFVINRFRWGGWGMTVSMDEDGLATALVKMGLNMPRIFAIFQRLNESHNSDADDVALLYVKKLRAAHASHIFAAIKQHNQLLKLLIRVMEEGWTTTAEKDAIQYLKGL
ncbi:MAG: hypothetical protein KDB03_15945 [Planctomycetales bacterium]|nr:hypothetical protein [Planctomycetales bacterium]